VPVGVGFIACWEEDFEWKKNVKNAGQFLVGLLLPWWAQNIVQ
jgi:hypothetical protein